MNAASISGTPALGVRGERAAIALAVGALVVTLALKNGAYDTVIRHEAGIAIYWVLALGLLVGVLPRTRPDRAGAVVLAALAALAAWTACSLLWTGSDDRTLLEVGRVLFVLGLVGLIAITLTRDTWDAAVAGAAAGAVTVCGVALWSRLSPGFLAEDAVERAFEIGRLNQPLGYWNALGAWASMSTVMCLAFSAHVRPLATRALALAVVPMTVSVSYLTYSRASLGGAALGLLVVFLLARNRWTLGINALAAAAAAGAVVLTVRGEPAIASGPGGDGRDAVLVVLAIACAACALIALSTGRFGLDRLRLPTRAARGLAVAAAVAAVAATVVAGAGVASSAWDQFTTVRAPSASDPAARLTNLNGGRYPVWKAAYDAFREEPVRGSGAGTYEFTWNRLGTEGYVKDAHSLYLETLSELGFVGLFLIALCVGAVAWVGVALRRAEVTSPGALAAAGAAVTVFLFGAGLDWLWESTAVAALAAILIGALLSAGGNPANGMRVPWRIVAAVVATAMGLAFFPALVSTSEIRRSQDAVRVGDVEGSLAHAQDAVEAAPWSGAGYVQRALVAERLGDTGRASADLARAAAREPDDWRIPLLQARVLARAGDTRGALAAYRRARTLRPQSDFFTLPAE